METSEYIEQYLNQSLSDTEKKDFESRLKSDKGFALEVKEYALLFNALDEIKATDLKQGMKQIEEGLESNKKKQNPFPTLLKWAAVFAVFAMASTWYFFNTGRSNEELFLAYYTTYPNVENPAVRSDTNQQGAWRFYSNGNYEDAYQQFQYSISNGNSNEATWFYLGICAIELNRYNQAEEAFDKVINIEDGRYKEQAEWFLALTHLKAVNKNATIEELEKISGSSSSYSTKAKELLMELR